MHYLKALSKVLSNTLFKAEHFTWNNCSVTHTIQYNFATLCDYERLVDHVDSQCDSLHPWFLWRDTCVNLSTTDVTPPLKITKTSAYEKPLSQNDGEILSLVCRRQLFYGILYRKQSISGLLSMIEVFKYLRGPRASRNTSTVAYFDSRPAVRLRSVWWKARKFSHFLGSINEQDMLK